MMKKTDFKSDQNTRSLLQKAVRRGADGVVERAVIRLIHNNEMSWLKSRLGIITFEESWGSVRYLDYTMKEDGLIRQYVQLARTSKNKDAAGLGSLAYELSNGDQSVLFLSDKRNRHIKILAEAIKRPDDFWTWVKGMDIDGERKSILYNAEVGFKLAGWPWDKAFALASAYLTIVQEVPHVYSQVANPSLEFPYWVAIDKHTAAGKRALAKCAEKFSVSRDALGWIQFYIESAKCVSLETSYWWEREKNWRLAREGFDMERAEIIWGEVAEFIHGLVKGAEVEMIEALEISCATYMATMTKQNSLI